MILMRPTKNGSNARIFCELLLELHKVYCTSKRTGENTMEFKTYPFNSLGDYFSADIMAIYKGQWIFCMHKERTTWEHPSGHVEVGETALEAAKRELYEETGAVDFEMEPLCDYYIKGEQNGWFFEGNGQVYFATVHSLEELPPYSEMGKIGFFDTLPENLTYPLLRDCFSIALQKKQSLM